MIKINESNFINRCIGALLALVLISACVLLSPGKAWSADGYIDNDGDYVYTVEDSGVVLNVNMKKNKDGSLTPVLGRVSVVSGDIKTNIIKKAVEELGADFDLAITVGSLNVQGASASTYSVSVKTSDLFSGQGMKMYDVTGVSEEKNYRIMDGSTYTLGGDGYIRFGLENGRAYRLVLSSDAASINEKIKKTVKANKDEIYVKVGKTYKMGLAAGANLDSIKTIAYTSSDNRYATVDTTGLVSAIAAGGYSYIIGTVIFNNGMTSEIKTKVHITKTQKEAAEGNKKTNPIKVKTSTYTVKVASKNNKTTKNATISAKKVAKNVTKAKGKVSFKKEAGNSKIKISSTGKITIKKGIASSKTGKNYSLDVSVKAHGNKTYQKSEKIMTVKIKVKTK